MRSTQGANVAQRLSHLVDWKPYRADNGAAPWLQRVAKLSAARSAVLALLGPSGVGVGKTKPVLDPATVYLVGLTDYVHGAGLSVSVALPPTAPQVPLLLAATTVLADTVNDASGVADKRRGVLLVSPDLDLRSKYCSLTVDREALEEAHPGSRMRPDGTRVSITKTAGLAVGGVCFFLPAGPLPTSIKFKPGLILLDLRYARWAPRADDFACWAKKIAPNAGVVALYTCGDRDTLQALRRAGYNDFPWDHAAVASSDRNRHPGSTEDPVGRGLDWDMHLAPSYLDRSHEIIEIQRAETTTALVSGLARLLQEHEGVDAPDLRRARWLLAVMQQLTVPMIWYEQSARDMGRSTIRRMIARLGSRSLSVPDGLGPVIQTLRLTFEHLYRDLEGENSRARHLVEAVSDKSKRGSVLVLVRDKVMEQATYNWLSVDALNSVDWLGKVAIRGCARFESHMSEEFDSAIINGALPRRYRWIVGSRLPTQVTFLCYPEEGNVVESQLKSFYDPARAQASAQRRDDVLKGIIPLDVAPSEAANTDGLLPPLHLIRPPQIEPQEKDNGRTERFHTVEGGLTGLRAALEAAAKEQEAAEKKSDLELVVKWEEDSSDDDSLPEDDIHELASSAADDVWCRILRVNSRSHGEGRLFLQDDIPVEHVRLSVSTDIKRAVPGHLKPADVILRVQDGRRSGLFERIVELAERQPTMQTLGAYRSKWRIAMTLLAQRYSDRSVVRYDRMLLDLKDAGAPIETELSLRWWIQGLVIGPEKLESIVAVGKVINDNALVDGARQFDRAFRKIRGIRQGIGRRLSTAIRRSFEHLDIEGLSPPSDDLDDTLGLPLDELLETIDLAEVVEVGQRQMVAPQLAGRLIGDRT